MSHPADADYISSVRFLYIPSHPADAEGYKQDEEDDISASSILAGSVEVLVLVGEGDLTAIDLKAGQGWVSLSVILGNNAVQYKIWI